MSITPSLSLKIAAEVSIIPQQTSQTNPTKSFQVENVQAAFMRIMHESAPVAFFPVATPEEVAVLQKMSYDELKEQTYQGSPRVPTDYFYVDNKGKFFQKKEHNNLEKETEPTTPSLSWGILSRTVHQLQLIGTVERISCHVTLSPIAPHWHRDTEPYRAFACHGKKMICMTLVLAGESSTEFLSSRKTEIPVENSEEEKIDRLVSKLLQEQTKIAPQNRQLHIVAAPLGSGALFLAGPGSMGSIHRSPPLQDPNKPRLFCIIDITLREEDRSLLGSVTSFL